MEIDGSNALGVAMRMQPRMPSREEIESLLVPLLRKAQIPGAGIAVVVNGERLAFGLGFRDLEARWPITGSTIFPIASTVKAFTATLLGGLVDAGRLQWDDPVQCHLPGFTLAEAQIARQVTLRDLMLMRTGLSAHSFVWMDNPISRADLLTALGHLPLSAPFRARFQYSDLSYSVAGHIAERIAGRPWETLMFERVLDPLRMHSARFSIPTSGDFTCGYHETSDRVLVRSRPMDSHAIGPAGGSLYASIEDMCAWIAFNLGQAKQAALPLPGEQTIAHIQSAQISAGDDSSAPSAGAAYGMGWFIDRYRDHTRVSHTGWLNDVQCCLSLFPQLGVGMMSYVNFASARLTSRLNELVFDLIAEGHCVGGIDAELAIYEDKISALAERRPLPRVEPTPSFEGYVGRYIHPAYGGLSIELRGDTLAMARGDLELMLEFHGGDLWSCARHDHDEIHKAQIFDPFNPLRFERDSHHRVVALILCVEPGCPDARFVRVTSHC